MLREVPMRMYSSLTERMNVGRYVMYGDIYCTETYFIDVFIFIYLFIYYV